MNRTNALIGAARRGNLPALQALLGEGACADTRDDEGFTVLMHAAAHGRHDAVSLLLQAGAAVDAISDEGDSALTEASRAGHADIVRLLLEHGADPNRMPRYHPHALGAAAFAGDAALCELLLANGADIDLEGRGHTSLSLAAWQEHEALACRLVEAGADVDRPECGEYVPAVLAAKNGLPRLLALILARTRRTIADATFTRALTEAAEAGHAQTVGLLLQRGCSPDFASPPEDPYIVFPLRQAAQNGALDIVTLLLAHGARVNERSAAGTALTAAAQHGHRKVVEVLLAHGADVDGKDLYGRDALGWSLCKERPRLAEVLMTAGAWPEPAQLDAAFLLVARTENVELVRRLLDAGANPDVRLTRDGIPHKLGRSLDEAMLRLAEALTGDGDADSEEGTSALMLAAEAGSLPMVDFLLARGADVDARNARGDTALIYATSSDDAGVVRRLMDAGASPAASNIEGWSAVHGAAGWADPDIVTLLVERGGDADRCDAEGWTPLMQALRENRPASARRLIALGAEAQARCPDGYTTVMAAARGECLDLLEELVLLDADIHARWAEEDRDALMLVAANGQTAAIRRLLELGADPRAVNGRGESAASLARRGGHEDASALLEAYGGHAGDESADAPRRARDAAYCRRLVSELGRSMPQLDEAAMLSTLPSATDDSDAETALLGWLHDGLAAQDLMRYEEWKGYWGDLPDLQPLEAIDMRAFSSQPLLDLLDAEDGRFFPHDVPYFSYQNDFLAPHGLRMLTLAFEHIYVFCVLDDAAGIAALGEALAEGGITLVDHPPMSLAECRAALRPDEP